MDLSTVSTDELLAEVRRRTLILVSCDRDTVRAILDSRRDSRCSPDEWDTILANVEGDSQQIQDALVEQLWWGIVDRIQAVLGPDSDYEDEDEDEEESKE